MKRRAACFLAAGLVLAAVFVGPLAYAGSWSFGAHGGAAIPMGDFGDKNKTDARTGWQAGGIVDYMMNDTWSFGVDGSWNQNTRGDQTGTFVQGSTTYSYNEDKFKTWQVGAHTHMMFPMQSSAFRPYALLGAGAYHTNREFSGTAAGGASTTVKQEGDTRFGGKLGLGGDWMFSPTMGIGLEAAYNMVSKEKGASSSLQYVGLQAGFKYSMPSPGH